MTSEYGLETFDAVAKEASPDVEVVARDPRTAETLQLEKAIEILESKIGSSGSGSPRS